MFNEVDCKLPPPIHRLDGEECDGVAAGEELHIRLIRLINSGG